MARNAGTGKSQRRVQIVENGPDPIGSGQWDNLARDMALELSSFGAPDMVRVGMKGSDVVTAYGDLGPLQRFPVIYPARDMFATPNPQALPGANSPIAGNTGLRGLIGSMGY